MTSEITIKGGESLHSQVSIDTSDCFLFAKSRAKVGEYSEPELPRRVVGHIVVEEEEFPILGLREESQFSYPDRYVSDLAQLTIQSKNKEVKQYRGLEELEPFSIGAYKVFDRIETFPKEIARLMEHSKKESYNPSLCDFLEQYSHDNNQSIINNILDQKKDFKPITVPDVDSHKGLVAAAQRLASRLGFFAGLEELLAEARASVAFKAPAKPEKSDVEEAQRGFKREQTKWVPDYGNNFAGYVHGGTHVHHTPSTWQYGFAASLAKDGLTGITSEDIPTTEKEMSWFKAGESGSRPILEEELFSLQNRHYRNGLTIWGNTNGVNYVRTNQEDYPVNEKEQTWFSAGRRGALMCLPSQQTERQNHLYRAGLEMWAYSQGFGIEDIGPRAEKIHHQVALQAFQYKHRDTLGGVR